MRSALLVLVAALGLAASQPAFAGDGAGSKLAGLISSCGASSVGDAWKQCVKAKLGGSGKGFGDHRGAPSRLRSLCRRALGARGASDCASKLGTLVAACKASSSRDEWKGCVRAQLGTAPGAGDSNEGAGAARTCENRSSEDGNNQCPDSRRPKPEQPPSAAGLDPATLAHALCRGPLGRKLGDGCVTTVTDALASCKSQVASGGDAFKACVTGQLRLPSAASK